MGAPARERSIYRRILAALSPKLPEPKTYPSATKRSTANLFDKRERSIKELESLEVRYLQGGPVRKAIDAYALFALSNGYLIEGDNDADVESVEEQLDSLDIESSMWQAIVDSLVFGDAFQELATGSGMMSDTVVAIYPRPAKMFDIKANEHGLVTGYIQYRDDKREATVSLSLDEILHISLFHLGGSKYGVSLVQSAKDDIDRDCQAITSLSDSIERHGHPRYHAKVGAEGETVPQTVLDRVADQLDGLKHNTELATCADVNIVALDIQGVSNAKEYSDVMMSRMACALGVPLGILGISEGNNRATAGTHKEAFEISIGAIQRRLARQYNDQLINRLLPDNKKGTVKLRFPDVDSEEQLAMAQYVAAVLQADPVSPIASAEWARKQLNIPEEDAYEGAPVAPKPDPFQPKGQTPPEPPEDKEAAA